MKNLSILLVVMFAAIISLNTGCKKDDPTGPTLTVSASSTTVDQGDTIVFTYSVSSNATLDKLTWSSTDFVLVEGSQEDGGEFTLEGTSDQDNEFTVVIKSTQTLGDITFSFTALDEDGEEYAAEKEIVITVEEAVVNVEINTFSSETLVSAFNASTTNQQYFDVTTGTLYNHSAVGANSATFGFVSGGASNGACIFGSNYDFTLSQTPSSWTNAATFTTTTLTGTEFDAITYEADLLAAMPSSITGVKVNLLQDGATNAGVTVLAFEINGKKGLIKLPESLNNDAAQSITVAVKVQQ